MLDSVLGGHSLAKQFSSQYAGFAEDAAIALLLFQQCPWSLSSMHTPQLRILK